MAIARSYWSMELKKSSDLNILEPWTGLRILGQGLSRTVGLRAVREGHKGLEEILRYNKHQSSLCTKIIEQKSPLLSHP